MGVDVLIRDGSEWMWRHLTSFSRFLPLIRTYRSASSQSQGDGWDWMDESNGEECGVDTGRGGIEMRLTCSFPFPPPDDRYWLESTMRTPVPVTCCSEIRRS